jgi:hypothetical protein
MKKLGISILSSVLALGLFGFQAEAQTIDLSQKFENGVLKGTQWNNWKVVLDQKHSNRDFQSSWNSYVDKVKASDNPEASFQETFGSEADERSWLGKVKKSLEKKNIHIEFADNVPTLDKALVYIELLNSKKAFKKQDEPVHMTYFVGPQRLKEIRATFGDDVVKKLGLEDAKMPYFEDFKKELMEVQEGETNLSADREGIHTADGRTLFSYEKDLPEGIMLDDTKSLGWKQKENGQMALELMMKVKYPVKSSPLKERKAKVDGKLYIDSASEVIKAVPSTSSTKKGFLDRFRGTFNLMNSVREVCPAKPA